MELKKVFDRMNDLKDLEKFVESEPEENLTREFKTVIKTKLSGDDLRNFAKALSGFANSSGGIIYWGIEASRDGSGKDVARRLIPIKNVTVALSKFNSLVGDYTSPRIDGVENKIIHQDKDNDSGYILTLVPVSESGPHMAKGKEHRYYKRSGESFYKMEHFDIEDMMGRRPNPRLSLVVEQSKKDSRVFHIGLENRGKGIAKFPYLKIFEVTREFKINREGKSNPFTIHMKRIITPNEGKYEISYGGTSDTVIYPGHKLFAGELYVNSPNIDFLDEGNLIFSVHYVCEGINDVFEHYNERIIINP